MHFSPFPYLDPGSGSFIIQIAIAALLGLSVALRASWGRIKGWFGYSIKDQEDDDVENSFKPEAVVMASSLESPTLLSVQDIVTPTAVQLETSAETEMANPLTNISTSIHSLTPEQSSSIMNSESKYTSYPIFISYSSQDKSVVHPLFDFLKKSGLECWLDEKKILIGEKIMDSVRDAIKDNAYTLIVLSKNSVKSGWCKLELQLAYQKEIELDRVVVLPIRIDSTDVPDEVKIKKYYQLDPKNEESFQQLAEEIKSLITKRLTIDNVQY